MTQVGVILAGGQSRRMGQDKALMNFRGERLIDRAIGKLAQQVDVLIVNRPQPLVDLPGHILQVSDAIEGFHGPLAGVHAALKLIAQSHLAAEENQVQLFTTPVDSPFFPMDLTKRLAEGGKSVSFATSQGQRHPVFARWPLEALGTIEQALATGHRKIDSVAAQIGFDEVEWDLVDHADGNQYDPFINVNTLDEFEAANPAKGEL